MAPHIRPRPTAIDQLPDECEGIIAWAVQELANTGRTQKEVYEEFSSKLSELQKETGLDFQIPHYVSFTRHNIRLAKLSQRMRRSQMIAEAVIARTDGQDEDNLMRAASRMLKTLIVEMMENAAENGFKPKEAASAAMALNQLVRAENLSTARRQKLEKELTKAVGDATDAVEKAGHKVDGIEILRIIREAYGAS